MDAPRRRLKARFAEAVPALDGFTEWWIRRDRKLEGQLDSLYARLGQRYWRPIAISGAGVSILMWLCALGVTSVWVGISLPSFFGLAAFVSACIGLTTAWVVRVEIRGPGRPIREWLGAGKPERLAPAAWRSAVDLPFVCFARIVPWRVAVGVALPMTLFIRFVVVDSWFHSIAAGAALIALLPCALVLNYFLAELSMRPIRRDASRGLVAGTSPPSTVRAGSSMRIRLLVALTAICDGTAVMASILTTRGPLTVTMFAVDVPIAVAVAAAAAFGLAMLFTETIVSPLEELVDATRAVRGGDLSARVPVQSVDELGILASSFNEMAAGLQLARERQVSTREEERRRLRRDLHDGLGPSLAALVMRLELADQLLESDPAGARKLIAELKSEAQDSVADIRRLVYELRPPSLDELGLVGAIRENAARLMPPGGPAFTMTAPDRLPSLPAAVEVAAYRIAQEAMANLVRHAGASSCAIRVELNGALELEVRDDGCGFTTSHHAGVGLASMRERAAELGGRCTVEAATGGGTVVRAQLPV